MTSFGFIWKNLFRKKVRTYLTFFCLCVAFLLYIALGSIAIIFSIDSLGGDLGANRLQTAAKYSMIESFPKRYVDEIAQLDGVMHVTHMTWFGGYYQEPNNMLVTFPVDPPSFFQVYPEYQISDEHLIAFAETRRGMVAPVETIQKYGWQIGGLVPIASQIYPQKDGSMFWEFELVGSYTSSREGMNAVLLHYDYFEEASAFGQGTVGWLGIQIADPELAPELSQQIDRMYINSSDPVKTSTESEANRQFLKQYGNISLMMSGILLAVFFTILLVCANTMSQAFRERVSELGVLKTIGFNDYKLGLWMLLEAICLSVLPAIIGTFLGIALLTLVGGSGVAAMFLPMPPMEILWSTAASAVALAVALGVIVGIVPALTTAQMSIVDAMNRN